jgi:hypothetical protein
MHDPNISRTSNTQGDHRCLEPLETWCCRRRLGYGGVATVMLTDSGAYCQGATWFSFGPLLFIFF